MTKQHLIDIIKRAAWTAAQTAVGGIGTATLIEQVPWSAVASTVALATLLSVLKSLGATPPETVLAEDLDAARERLARPPITAGGGGASTLTVRQVDPQQDAVATAAHAVVAAQHTEDVDVAINHLAGVLGPR